RDDQHMRGSILVTDDPGDTSQQKRLQGKEPNVEHEHRLYRQQHLNHQHQPGEERYDLRGGFWNARVHGWRNRNVDTSAKVARTNAALSKSGTRKSRSF